MSLDEFLSHIERDASEEYQYLQNRIVETSEFLDKQWSKVTELRPASEPHSLIKKRSDEINIDDEVVAVAQMYVYLCLLDAVESLFEHEVLRRRLTGINPDDT